MTEKDNRVLNDAIDAIAWCIAGDLGEWEYEGNAQQIINDACAKIRIRLASQSFVHAAELRNQRKSHLIQPLVDLVKSDTQILISGGDIKSVKILIDRLAKYFDSYCFGNKALYYSTLRQIKEISEINLRKDDPEQAKVKCMFLKEGLEQLIEKRDTAFNEADPVIKNAMICLYKIFNPDAYFEHIVDLLNTSNKQPFLLKGCKLTVSYEDGISGGIRIKVYNDEGQVPVHIFKLMERGYELDIDKTMQGNVIGYNKNDNYCLEFEMVDANEKKRYVYLYVKPIAKSGSEYTFDVPGDSRYRFRHCISERKMTSLPMGEDILQPKLCKNVSRWLEYNLQ